MIKNNNFVCKYSFFCLSPKQKGVIFAMCDNILYLCVKLLYKKDEFCITWLWK